MCVEQDLETEIPSSILYTPENERLQTLKSPNWKGTCNFPDLHFGVPNVDFPGCSRFIQFRSQTVLPLHWNRQRLDSPGRKPPLVVVAGVLFIT